MQMLPAFFVLHADVVRFASFHLQAETGWGAPDARAQAKRRLAGTTSAHNGRVP